MSTSDSPTGAPTFEPPAVCEMPRTCWDQNRCLGNCAALSAQAPPSETVDRALNVFHEYAESQARAGAQAPPAPEPVADSRVVTRIEADPRGCFFVHVANGLPYKFWHKGGKVVGERPELQLAVLAGTPQAAIGAPTPGILATLKEALDTAETTPALTAEEVKVASDWVYARAAGHPAQAVASRREKP